MVLEEKVFFFYYNTTLAKQSEYQLQKTTHIVLPYDKQVLVNKGTDLKILPVHSYRKVENKNNLYS